jgi:polyisoprenoid-binding protein YceI
MKPEGPTMKNVALLGVAALSLSIALPLVLIGANPAAPAPVPAVPTAPSAPSAPTVAGAWEIDAVHSSLVFKTRHMGVAPFYGRFKQLSGTVAMNAEKPAESKVELTIPVAGIDTNNSGRDEHLKSADFFNASEFPDIKFASKSVQKTEKGWKVDGELSMHGVTKALSLDVVSGGTVKSPKGEVAGFETTITFKRSDFGISYGLEGIGDEVTLLAGIECKAP